MIKIKKKKTKKQVKTGKNAIIYVRVSTEEQAEKGYSLDAQKLECIKYAKSKGLNVLKIFIEEGESAKSTNRTEFKKMMKYCKEFKSSIDYVIFWKTERFMRKLKDLVQVTETLENYGIEVLSVTEPNEKGAAGNLTRNMLGALAQYDNELKSERVTNGMRQAMRSGRWLWRAPYGYYYDEKLGNIVPKAPESEIVKTIFEKLSTGCYSQADILAELKKQGVILYPTHMCKILRNPIYSGYMVKEEWFEEPVKGTFKPLISEKLFNTVQDILDGRKPVITPHDFKNENYPLKQFLVCPNCGKPLTGSASTGRNNEKYPYYHCYNKKCTHKFSMSKDEVEQGFLEVLQQLKPKDELIDLFKVMVSDVYKELTNEETRLNKQLTKQLDELIESKKNIIRLYANKCIEEDDYKMMIEDCKEKEKNIKTNLQSCELPHGDFEKCLKSSLKVIQNIDKAWQQSVYRVKKSLQNLIFPNGLSADFSSFQNTSIATIFTKIGALSAPYYEMVPPSEFESLSTP